LENIHRISQKSGDERFCVAGPIGFCGLPQKENAVSDLIRSIAGLTPRRPFSIPSYPKAPEPEQEMEIPFPDTDVQRPLMSDELPSPEVLNGAVPVDPRQRIQQRAMAQNAARRRGF
jgi:hypothetical protein